jgi:hypothetical protein
MTHAINRKGQEMANTGVKNGKNLKTKQAKPKELSKAGEWLETHPNGIGKILDMRAVMK